MRIHLLSDLHLDFSEFEPPPTDADVVILAGDIGEGTTGVKWAKQKFTVPVIYIAGNHEYYTRRDWPATLASIQQSIRAEADGSNVHFLENESIVFGDVRFLCATLWTDFNFYGNVERGMMSARMVMSDFRGAICTDRGFFRPSDACALHEASVAWLDAELSQSWQGSTVVVTHFLPSALSVAPQWQGDHANTGFASNLDRLVEKADLWVHGHSHSPACYRTGGCRVVCNPRGYTRRAHPANPENTAFNPAMVLDV